MAGIRVFFSIPMPPGVQAAAAAYARALSPYGAETRWEEREKLHLTVKFIGEVEEPDAHAMLAAVREGASSLPPVGFTVAGLGAFPSLARPRVIWIGCGNDGGGLERLHRTVESRLASLGVPVDGQPFHPHVTIGRVRASGVRTHLTSLPENVTFEPHRVHAAELLLVKSVLRPGGSVHTVIGSAGLSQGDS